MNDSGGCAPLGARGTARPAPTGRHPHTTGERFSYGSEGAGTRFTDVASRTGRASSEPGLPVGARFPLRSPRSAAVVPSRTRLQGLGVGGAAGDEEPGDVPGAVVVAGHEPVRRTVRSFMDAPVSHSAREANAPSVRSTGSPAGSSGKVPVPWAATLASSRPALYEPRAGGGKRRRARAGAVRSQAMRGLRVWLWLWSCPAGASWPCPRGPLGRLGRLRRGPRVRPRPRHG